MINQTEVKQKLLALSSLDVRTMGIMECKKYLVLIGARNGFVIRRGDDATLDGDELYVAKLPSEVVHIVREHCEVFVGNEDDPLADLVPIRPSEEKHKKFHDDLVRMKKEKDAANE